MAYIGNTQYNRKYEPAVDYFNGNGSTTAFTLSRPVASVAAVQAVISNVPQNPGSAFTVSGNTITFTSAPPSGTNNIYVYYTSPNTQIVQPGQGTVGTTQLQSDLTLTNPTYTGTLTGGTGVVNIGSGQVYKDSSGNVGIGTISPSGIGSSYTTVDLRGGSGGGVRMGTAAAGNALVYGNAGGLNLQADGANSIIAYTNAAERMRIDSSGRVTMPYQPAFSVKNAPSTSATNTIIYPNIILNTGNSYSASTGRFTSQVSGSYYFSVYALAISGNCNIRLRKNGGTFYYSESDESGYHQISVSGIIPLSVGDYVDVEIYTGSTYQAYDNFSGFLIG